jgi:hypothetical protein
LKGAGGVHGFTSLRNVHEGGPTLFRIFDAAARARRCIKLLHTVGDANEPLRIRWFSDSFLEVPVSR